MRVDLKDLRLQLEQEAMGKLIKLRQGVLAAGQRRPSASSSCSAASASAIMIIFRAVLRLHGATPPTDNVRSLTAAGAAQAGFDAAPFAARGARTCATKSPLKAADAADVLAGYLRGMEQLVAYLDRYQA